MFGLGENREECLNIYIFGISTSLCLYSFTPDSSFSYKCLSGIRVFDV